MAGTKVLLLGGHGRVSLLLTSLLLKQSWHVTSLVRNADHKSEILESGKDQPGKVDVLVESLEDMKDEVDVQKVLDRVKPEVVVWSAGAGGKGGPARTKAVDEIAAKLWISASLASSNVKKFMMISYIGSRRSVPPWWTSEDKKAADHVNTEVLPGYFKAKVEADEHLVALAYKRAKDGDKAFQAINLRPGTLKDDAGTGKILLSKTSSRGDVPRADVAATALALLERNDTRGWFDMLSGDKEINKAVDEAVSNGWDSIEGEDLGRIHARVN